MAATTPDPTIEELVAQVQLLDQHAFNMLNRVNEVRNRLWDALDKLDSRLEMPSNMVDRNLSAIRTATFHQQKPTLSTSGVVTLDWASAQNHIQMEPNGTITYIFLPPPGPCHLQLLIESENQYVLSMIYFPESVMWFGSNWQGSRGKRAIINFWYDGYRYMAMGVNQA